jgi:LEA14-like dessication related protein
MLELGWIENQKVMQWYETNLKAGKVAEVRARAEADFKKNLITSEVLALMTYLTR